jgi:hypothetical protein
MRSSSRSMMIIVLSLLSSVPLVGQIAVTVKPRVASITFTQAQQFAAAVSGTTNTAVTWSVDGIVGGNSTVGTISSTGRYKPPSAWGPHTILAISQADGATSASAQIIITNYAGVFTYHNDNARDGLNPSEIVLTPANVNYHQFGKRFSYVLDAHVYAQPLYVANVSIPSKGFHNLVYVATENDSLYAFDADGRSKTPIWMRNFTDSTNHITAVPCAATQTCVAASTLGITGTPVIDAISKTLYVVTRTQENGAYVQRLQAVDIATGADKFGGSVVIDASVAGTGEGSQDGTIPFDNLTENDRPALLLIPGTPPTIFIGFGTPGDIHPYHGWLLGYSPVTSNSLVRTATFNTTPNGNSGGLWSVGALTADASNNIFVGTGQGTFDGGQDWGDSVLKMSTTGGTLAVTSSFTPSNEATLDAMDLDFGSGSPLLLPRLSNVAVPQLLVIGTKTGEIYLLNRASLGGFHSTGDQVVQSLAGLFTGVYTSASYWNGYVYIGGAGSPLEAFKLSNGLLPTTATSQTGTVFGFPGANPVVSSSGNANAIVWALQRVGTSGILRAYTASALGTALYNSTQAGTRDLLNVVAKFSSPTVANGKVYVAGNDANDNGGRLFIFGLLPQP